jgi:serine/alanine adding enzyme
LILAEFDKLCRMKVIYSQFRNLWDAKLVKTGFTKQGYSYEEHLDFHFDLQQGKEALWNAIHPTRRKQINRGLKRGVRTQLIDANQGKELDACFAILKQVYREAKLPYPGINYFRNAIRILGSRGYFKIVLALFNDEIIGFRFFLCYQDQVYDWYAGSNSAHYDKYPNDILPWEILKWGAENGCKLFDFGGAGKPGVSYGVRDYKLKFGGTLVNYGRFEKVHKPILMAIAKNAFKLWKLLKH